MATKEVEVLTKKQAANLAKEASKRPTPHSQRGATSKSGPVIMDGKKVQLG